MDILLEYGQIFALFSLKWLTPIMRSILLSVVLVAFALSPSRAGQYFQDFTAAAVGAQSFGDGSQLFTTSSSTITSVRDATLKALQLTDATNANTRAAFLLRDLDPGVTNYAFSARWNAKISGNFTNVGNGFSFNFGQLAALSLTNSAYAQESGYPTGLCFSVQTAPTKPGFYLRVNGGDVAAIIYSSVAELWGVNSTTNHLFEMDWNYTNGVTVRLNGQTIFANIPTYGLTFRAGNRFAWAARAGAQSETVQIDNLLIMSGGNLLPVSMTAPYYKSGEYLPNNQTADKAFDGLDATKWLTQTSTGYVGATSAFGNRVTRAYSITTAEDVPTRDPRTWALQGSTNSGTNWSTCGNGSNGMPKVRNNRTTTAVPNAARPLAMKLEMQIPTASERNMVLNRAKPTHVNCAAVTPPIRKTMATSGREATTLNKISSDAAIALPSTMS